MATDLLEMLTVPEGFGSAATAANETRQPNAISHVANNFFVIAVLPWTGNPLYYRFVLQVCRTCCYGGAGTNTESSSRTPAGINHHRRVRSTLSKDSQIARWFIGADARAMAAQTAIREWAVTDEAAFHERAIAPLSIIVPRCWPP